MKKAILLLHGFKRNNVNDFEQVEDFISEISKELNVSEVYNEIWFHNYEKKTLSLKYFDKRAKEVAKKISDAKIDELIVIGYSTGTIFAANVIEKLNIAKVQFLGIAPTFKPHIWKWRKTLKKMKQVEKELIKKLGKERYKRIKKAKHNENDAEKYPLKIIFYLWKKVIGKRKGPLEKYKGGKFLIAKDDHIVKSDVAIKILSKSNEITVEDFVHDLITRKEKQILIDWLSKNIVK